MREEFEKLPEIIEYLKDAEWSELTQRYIAKRVNHYRAATFMNGAYYAYQEQQKKIDEIVSIVREADLSDGDSSVAIVHDEIQELLK